MTEDRTQTGTPEQDGGDAAEQTPTTGTPATEGRDGGASEPDYKSLYLGLKPELEAKNDKLREYESRAASPPAMPPTNQQPDPRSEYRNQVYDLARRGDPVAMAQVETWEWQDASVKAGRDQGQLMAMPEGIREQVFQHYEKNRHRLGDPIAARAEIENGSNAKRLAELEAEIKRLKGQTSRPDPDVVRTFGQEHTAAQHKDRISMTGAKFDAEVKALKDAGRFREAMNRERMYANGDIQITDE